MALTDESDIFCGIHEDGFNLLVRHLMRQRPPLFNYGTAYFAQGIQKKQVLCSRIEVARDYQGPLITVEDPLPIIGCPLPLGIDWCFQLGELTIGEMLSGQTIAVRLEAAGSVGATLKEAEFGEGEATGRGKGRKKEKG